MKTRELAILLAALLFGGGVLFTALFGDPETSAPPTPQTPIAQQPDESAPAASSARTASTGSPVASPRQIDPESNRADVMIGAAATSGTIDGRIRLTGGIGDKFTGYTIYVREMVDSDGLKGEREPFSRSYPFKAEANRSPLYFAVFDLPFSRFGYEVSVYVPGLNGSTTRIACTPQQSNPQVGLWLTKGGPYALRLIDQQRNPVADRDVILRPIDWPPGRPVLQGRANSFGTVIFEHALGGDYEVLVDRRAIERVTIAMPGVVADQAELGLQSKILVVPSGHTVRVEVLNAANYGLAGAELLLTQVDTQLLYRLEGVSDFAGIYEFPDVPPGTYQLDVRYTRHQPRSIRVRVTEDAEQTPQRVRMVPVR